MKTIEAAVGAVGFAMIAAIITVGLSRSLAADSEARSDAVADTNGNLHVPDGYQATYEFLGTWAAAADKGQGSQELHVVYASPGTIAVYRKEGRFPDGTVLVKEVYRAATEPMTTGTISHSNTLRGWFVMMKDSTGRYAANKPI